MFTDNPSYFSLSSGTATSSVSTTPASTTSVAFSPPSKGPTGLTALFRRRPCKMGTTSSASVLSTSTTSTLIPQDNNKGSTSGASTPTEEKMPMLPRNGTGQCGNGTHGGPGNQRRSFRNLFRSVSANADHERTQQFLKGDPRPSDVAPPSPYLPHRLVTFPSSFCFFFFFFFDDITEVWTVCVLDFLLVCSSWLMKLAVGWSLNS